VLGVLSLAFLLFNLAGCGFQPRGHAVTLTGVPSPVYVAGIASYTELSRELRLQLTRAGVEIAPSAAESASVLRVSGVNSKARVLSVNSRNKAVEYELEESASFALRTRDGQQLVEPQRVSVLRIQYRPEVGVLGSDREGKLMRRDMRRDVAGRIVRRLAAQH
jgi:LPS-assembly lipoprotein